MKLVENFNELPAEKVRWRCDLSKLKFKTTDEVEVKEKIIGQDRAVDALTMGLDIDAPGYNIFVIGEVGTGRKTTVNHLIKKTQRINRIPDDKIYVHNFKSPEMPCLIRLPAGKGKEFKKDMDNMINYLLKKIPEIVDSEEYQNERKKIIDEIRNEQQKLIKEFELKVEKEKFVIVKMEKAPDVPPMILPVIDGKPVSFDELLKMVEEGKFSQSDVEKLIEKRNKLTEEMGIVGEKIANLNEEIENKIKLLEKRLCSAVIKNRTEMIKKKYENKKINEYLTEVEKSLLEDIDEFKKGKEKTLPEETLLYYKVNLLVDNSEAKHAPVIFETSPTYANLFGTIEMKEDKLGRWSTDFTKIKAGSFIRADGGFLIIEALDALIEPGVWPAIKRTLRNGRVEIQIYSPFYTPPLSTIKPEPIPCDVKVIMVGSSFIYHLLYEFEEDFKKIFKVRADFDSVMPNSDESIDEYISFVKKICTQEKLKPFDKTAVAAIIEYGVKISGKQNKLSTKFNNIADIIREANYWANKDGSKIVNEKHVEKAIEEKVERTNLIQEKIQEMINEGKIMIDTEGKTIGQVNGLSVLSTGEYSFGIPVRITAKVSLGTSGIINIERESELSGKIYNKAMLILSGYLSSKYALNKPLVVNASICFEQSYSVVEGDSASAAEVFALLSTLSELPIRQDIAVTGSINQNGEIQPVGGINEKIEGFYDVCKIKGLTGTQGVIIPHQNVDDLMLRKDIVSAIKEKKFHIYPIKTIDEGIEILTGVKAGVRLPDGSYEEGTVHFLVDKRLSEFAERWKTFRVSKEISL